MDLQTFVKESLIQIINGVSDSQKAALQKQAHVNPGKIHRFTDSFDVDIQSLYQEIEFDVAVTVSSDHTTEGGGSLKVATGIFGAGVGVGGEGKHQRQTSDSTVSHVKFKVPITLPLSV